MSATAQAPPPGDRDPRLGDRRIRRRFFRHLVGGFAVGLFLGAVGYLVMLWLLASDPGRIPLAYGLLAMYQTGMLGGLVGAGIFMRRIGARDDEDPPGPGGGHAAGVVDDRPLPAPQQPARPPRKSAPPVPVPA